MTLRPLLLLLLATPSAAQIPDTFVNLQVLPRSISREELLAVMRGFSLGVGVRCEFCHVGEGGPELKNMNFASDDKEVKRTARRMLLMVQAINGEHLAKLGRETPAEVQCVTCHRGLSRPRTLVAVLAEALERDGIAPAVARYRELRKEHYGGGGYDFSADSLNQLGQALLAKDKAQEAAAMLELNVEFNPGSSFAHYLLGEAYRASGEREKAMASYRKSLEINPQAAWARKRLEELSR